MSGRTDSHPEEYDEAPLTAEIVPEPASSTQAMLDNPWVILGLLFFVTGALGLPFLWKSRAFGVVAKTLLSVVVTLYTLGLLWITKWIWLWSYSQWKPFLETL